MRRNGERDARAAPLAGRASRYDGARMPRVALSQNVRAATGGELWRALSAAVALALGCASAPVAEPAIATPNGALLRGAELAQARCLLVAPFENASDVALAAETATSALLTGVDPARARVFPIAELRDVFRDTPLELPAGIAPSLALELAELVGADAAVYGVVEGGGKVADPHLLVSVRVAVAGRSPAPVRPHRGGPRRPRRVAGGRDPADGGGARSPDARAARRPGPEAVLRSRAHARAPPLRALRAAPGAAAIRCLRSRFDGARERRARRARAQPSTPRQAEWARRLAAGERIVVDDVAFAGRTSDLLRDGGLADLAIALAASPGIAVHLEAFVDTTATGPPTDGSRRAMAHAAADRLFQLGVERARHRLLAGPRRREPAPPQLHGARPGREPPHRGGRGALTRPRLTGRRGASKTTRSCSSTDESARPRARTPPRQASCLACCARAAAPARSRRSRAAPGSPRRSG